MLYIYRRKGSTGARELAEQITVLGTVARRTKGLALRTLTPQDAVVCWGDNFAAAQGTKTLNNVPVISKFQEAHALNEGGVSTVQVSRTRPAVAQARAVARPAFVERPFEFGGPIPARLSVAEANVIAQRITAHINAENIRRRQHDTQPAPAPVAAETWLPRRNNHIGGNDLLNAPDEPDFYSKKEDIVDEFRLHMFKGKSIRAGRKVQNPTRPNSREASHPWIRSYDAGWVIRYDAFESTKAQRELAAKALKVLGLDFGAVDMGLRRDGTLIVLEVNRAPGVEGGTTQAYAKKIIEWAKGE